MKIGVVLLASGLGRRFGGNKLLAQLNGRPMIRYALEALSCLDADHKVIVTASEEIAAVAKEYGFVIVQNDAPEIGQGHSVSLGAEAMEGMDAVLFLAGDQPLISGKTLNRLCMDFEHGAAKVACLRDETHFGNPAIFSSTLFPQLMALDGDRGAKGILKAQGQSLLVVDCLCENELFDVDDDDALHEAERIINSRRN